MGLDVACVIVTYNRLALLKEAIAAVMAQTYKVGRIIVVDNASTDGTGAYLSSLSSQDRRILVVSMERNTGGSGGFSEGIKRAALMRPDWIWIMDDDTIPHADALEKMVPYTADERVGYLCSKVVWTDGEWHLMNRPCTSERKPQWGGWPRKESVQAMPSDTFRIKSASFVSLLIKGIVPYKVGLPYKEFFIWEDDVEYTKRMHMQGWLAYCVVASVVVHKTKTNYVSGLNVIPASSAWKLYYGMRNNTFLKRKRKNFILFLFSCINKYRLRVHRVKKRHLPKEEEKALLSAIRRGMFAGLTFNPRIEYLG